MTRSDGGAGAVAAGPAHGREVRFPPRFLWGAATSSHQTEGGNRGNDWWSFEESGRLQYRSGDACQHYERFEHDFDLAAAGGHNAHRFSVEWSRVEPSEGRWSEEALDHYARVVAALRERDIEPIVTLHHFTNPAWFAASGGWSRRDAPRRFARYVERVCAA
ncbi:MAG: family 1 glycosylhydrolase, partial [Gemmatimonadota bacterium]